eukprot:GHVL01039463.1.p1 GENE.GHVL01039463.1~~GHVL01039463.1.p1  ORF type:complete len:331 (+),score=42.89 GHVL01039463.1:300-1292(+)
MYECNRPGWMLVSNRPGSRVLRAFSSKSQTSFQVYCVYHIILTRNSAADINGDQRVGFSEYLFFVTMLLTPVSDLQMGFRLLDTNCDGFIDRSDFNDLISRILSNFGETNDTNSPGIRLEAKSDFYSEMFYKEKITFDHFSRSIEKLHTRLRKMLFWHLVATDKGASRMKKEEKNPYISGTCFSTYLRQLISPNSTTLPSSAQLSFDNLTITLGEFSSFHSLVEKPQDLLVALELSAVDTKKINQEQFTAACNSVVTTKIISENLTKLIFATLDADRDGSLGLNEIYDFIYCCKKNLLFGREDSYLSRKASLKDRFQFLVKCIRRTPNYS